LFLKDTVSDVKVMAKARLLPDLNSSWGGVSRGCTCVGLSRLGRLRDPLRTLPKDVGSQVHEKACKEYKYRF
jgi:hypothetical protein